MKKGNVWGLLPIGVFVVFYLTLGIVFEYVMKIPMGFYSVPVVVAFMVAILVAAILVLYMLNVSKAACVHDPATNTLKVLGVRERTIDLNKVACLQTITVKSGHVEGRSLAFTDAEGGMVAIVPTYFTSNRGMQAEPMAKEMAADLGLEFQANVPAWEYDEEARKAHEIEVAQQEKEDAKRRKEGRKALREAKLRKKMEEIRNEKKQ
jgi:hypothetical protein